MPQAGTKIAANNKERERVLSKATIRAAERLGIPAATLARTIGLSPSTISRLKSGQYILSRSDKSFELSALVVRLFRGIDAITGGDDQASRSWLTSENTALRGRPVDLIQTVVGLNQTVMYVDSRRAKI